MRTEQEQELGGSGTLIVPVSDSARQPITKLCVALRHGGWLVLRMSALYLSAPEDALVADIESSSFARWHDIYAQGGRARAAGGSIGDCPMAPFSVAAVVWLSGFTGSSVSSVFGHA